MVGRISAQIDTLHREIYGEDTGHFGFIEAIEDVNVFEALCKVAEKWLYDRGARRITGPLGFSLNQECGLLIDGFEHPPMLMMPHSRPWYGPMLEEQGYSPVKDLLAYWINIGYEPTKMMTALSARYGSKIKIRSLNLQILQLKWPFYAIYLTTPGRKTGVSCLLRRLNLQNWVLPYD